MTYRQAGYERPVEGKLLFMGGPDEFFVREVNELLRQGQDLYDRLLHVSFDDVATRKFMWSKVVELQGRISRLIASTPDVT